MSPWASYPFFLWEKKSRFINFNSKYNCVDVYTQPRQQTQLQGWTSACSLTSAATNHTCTWGALGITNHWDQSLRSTLVLLYTVYMLLCSSVLEHCHSLLLFVLAKNTGNFHGLLYTPVPFVLTVNVSPSFDFCL